MRKGYSITNCNTFGRVFTCKDGARSIVEMQFCTLLIALVGAANQLQSSPRKLQIVNTEVRLVAPTRNPPHMSVYDSSYSHPPFSLSNSVARHW
ncbi:hypothetical protein K439DRAFT_1556337 [Ramaria rubella]|nr:hypothetical protein K439DRAFT_1556337 [Ramaria rubella]